MQFFFPGRAHCENKTSIKVQVIAYHLTNFRNRVCRNMSAFVFYGLKIRVKTTSTHLLHLVSKSKQFVPDKTPQVFAVGCCRDRFTGCGLSVPTSILRSREDCCFCWLLRGDFITSLACRDGPHISLALRTQTVPKLGFSL